MTACGSSEDDYVEALTGERPRQVRDRGIPSTGPDAGRDAEVVTCPDEAPECEGGCEPACDGERWMCTRPDDPPADRCGGGDEDCDGIPDEDRLGTCCDGGLEPPCNGAPADTDVPGLWTYLSGPGIEPIFVMQHEVTARFWDGIAGNQLAAPGDAGPEDPVTEADVFLAMAFANAASLDRERTTCYRDEGGRSMNFDMLDDARAGRVRFTLVAGCTGMRLPRISEVRAMGMVGWSGMQVVECPVLEGECPGDWCERAWCDCNETDTQPVGGRQANEAGIFDLVGNVTEWGWPDDAGGSPSSAEPWPLYGGAVGGGMRHECGLDGDPVRIYEATEASPDEQASLRVVGFRLVQSGAVDGR